MEASWADGFETTLGAPLLVGTDDGVADIVELFTVLEAGLTTPETAVIGINLMSRHATSDDEVTELADAAIAAAARASDRPSRRT